MAVPRAVLDDVGVALEGGNRVDDSGGLLDVPEAEHFVLSGRGHLSLVVGRPAEAIALGFVALEAVLGVERRALTREGGMLRGASGGEQRKGLDGGRDAASIRDASIILDHSHLAHVKDVSLCLGSPGGDNEGVLGAVPSPMDLR